MLRYSRHLALEDFGLDGQLKLKHARILVVGAGGLGCPVLLYLTAAGVGKLGIADCDQVEVSNLQRQVLFTVQDVGKNKADAAVARLRQLNANIQFVGHALKISSSNLPEIIEGYDLVVDATDNFPARYLLNDACVLLNRPLVYGSVLRFEGQVACFNVRQSDGSFSANYRDLFPQPPAPDSVQDCEQAGVLGVLPGMIGTLQANEAIKIVCGLGEVLANKLLLVDLQSMEFNLIRIQDHQAREQIRGLIDYEDFCGLNQQKTKYLEKDKNSGMKEITVQELKALKDSKADFQLIDVREPHEYDICNLDGELIPMAEIPSNVDKISREKQVVIHCRSGKRSGEMVLWLEKNEGFTNLYNLKGGVLAWAKEVDPEMPTY